ncbi:hypothetical protein [Burkholderia contaminans]|uniref:Uncharacterized protein n=1 Tax=Burkholderia contaminans TaxID=488447 RepID=A0A3N8PFB0_9BURK|nr:hypothetical protein [Burkholderia contaminans]RQT09810.1 hypothetical protein DF051_29440 [Burkholderia contaminans]
MAFDFDAVINTPEGSVDMKAGLETLQGVSDAARCIAETLLTEHVPKRQTHKKDVRTILKQSFKGSYGHVFGIEIYDEDAQKKLRKMSRPVFLELMDYFLNEAVYKDHEYELSEAANRIMQELGEKADILTKQLRKSAMHNLHAVPEKFGYGVKIRYRKNRDDQTTLASFDQVTAATISAKPAREDVKITVAITRLNINTGNGRLNVLGSDDTVAFGFKGLYARVSNAIKEPISVNLAYNNLRTSDQWQYMEIVARPIQLRDGKVIKYIVKER